MVSSLRPYIPSFICPPLVPQSIRQLRGHVEPSGTNTSNRIRNGSGQAGKQVATPTGRRVHQNIPSPNFQGSATVGLKSKTHVILVALKRSTSELSSYQNKIFPVDDHVGVSIAGLTADGRLLCKFMRTECLNSRYVYNSPFPISRLVSAVGNSILCVAVATCFRAKTFPWQPCLYFP